MATWGCGDTSQLDLAPKPVFEAKTTAPLQPFFGPETRIALLNSSSELYVGAPADKAMDHFGRPRRAYEFRDLPEGFTKDYRSMGWENDLEGFGIITYRDRVAVAVREWSATDAETVDEAVATYSRRYGPTDPEVVEGKSGRYWFWEIERHRMMICAVPGLNNRFHLVLAIGERNSMDYLRMSADRAREDIVRADRALNQPAP